jgi:hypothetical protein
MHQKSLYFCLSFAVSSLILYVCVYSNIRGVEHFQPQPALFNVRNVSYNSTNQDKEAIAGQNIDQGLANVSRAQDNLYDVQNKTLGVRLEVCLSTESPVQLTSPSVGPRGVRDNPAREER